MASILNLRRDDSSDSILLHVRQTGADVLDLRLIATDGQSPFTADLKRSDISKSRSPQFRGTDDEWAAILLALFKSQPIDDDDLVRGVEAVASVTDNAISLLVRRDVSGITQRLGSITLSLDEEEPIELFDWTGIAARAAADRQTQLLAARQSNKAQQDTILRLTAQLDQLVDVKRQHDDELMKKFAALLNLKKLKIRDQQRLLSLAKIDPNKAKHVQQTRSESSSRKPNASSERKRKAKDVLEESESDNDAEPEDDDQHVHSDDHATPAVSTDDDTDDDAFDVPAPASHKSQTLNGDQSVPPRRELPFANPPGKTASAAAEDAETENETDDEL